jgi:hypothetical protein
MNLRVQKRVVVNRNSFEGLGPIPEAFQLVVLRHFGHPRGLLTAYYGPVGKNRRPRFAKPTENQKVAFQTECPTEITEKNRHA